MKIGVLSDTHIPGKAKALPKAVLDAFAGADHIIHAGDILSTDVLNELGKLAPVTAVAGNIDPPELRYLLGEKKIILLGGFRFGIVHGHGSKGTTLGRAIKSFGHDDVDCIIFGHSHYPYCGYHEGILLFNPGSPTDKRRNMYYSAGLLEAGKRIKPRIFYFDKEGFVR